MKTVILTGFLFSGVFFLFCEISFSQYSNSDTSHTLLSSSDYDYKNPQFDKTGSSGNYFIKDCILAYEKWISPSNSIIAVRFMNYNSLSAETELTGNTSQNINPAVAYPVKEFTQPENNPGAVVFQTNRNGNWDIYFSYYNSVSWSVPVPVASDTADETEPGIVPYINTNNVLNFLIAYKKNNDIYLKNYHNGVWMNEVNVTVNDSLECFSPEITQPLFNSQDDFYVAYNRKNSQLINSIALQWFYVFTNGSINHITTTNIIQPNSQDNIRFSNGNNHIFLNYDYDTLGRKNFYSALTFHGNCTFINQTPGYAGDNFGGTGSSHGAIISDFLSGDYTVYSWIRRINDSTRVAVTRNSYYPNLNEYYVGDASANTFVNTSTKLVFHNDSYRIRILWEKEINGRTALIESFKDDYLSSLNNSNELIPDIFSLSQNYPNPFNPVTHLEFGISNLGFVSLKVYDALGKEVKILVNEIKPAGNYEVEFDGSDLPGGIYFYKLQSGDFAETKRMILLK